MCLAGKLAGEHGYIEISAVYKRLTVPPFDYLHLTVSVSAESTQVRAG